jgi:hypothetical protein
LTIPPCTTGKHSTVDDTPAEPEKESNASSVLEQQLAAATLAPAPPRHAVSPAIAPPSNAATPVVEDTEDDDPSLEIPANATCRRRGCNKGYDPSISRDAEKCVYHPGQPIFHEGSKGWSCCKRRVLEFDEFMKIQGCKEKTRHLFVGKGKPAGEEKVETVRYACDLLRTNNFKKKN